MKIPALPVNNRDQYALWLFSAFAILLVYRWNSSAFLSFNYGQPMKGPDVDYAFWFSMCLGFPHFIINHKWACFLVDAMVIFSTAGCLLSAKYRWLFCRILLLFFFVQRMTVETYCCSHTKSISCVFVALFPFCFRNEKNYTLMVEGGRFLLIFILVSSSYHKLHNGGLLHAKNFSVVLVNQHIDLAILNPGHISFKVATKLIASPWLAAFSYIILFLSQLTFAVGFFTKKADRILFILLAGFAVSTYYIMRIYNFDILLLGLCLLYFPRKNIN